jgi:hypothetical protein
LRGRARWPRGVPTEIDAVNVACPESISYIFRRLLGPDRLAEYIQSAAVHRPAASAALRQVTEKIMKILPPPRPERFRMPAQPAGIWEKPLIGIGFSAPN